MLLGRTRIKSSTISSFGAVVSKTDTAYRLCEKVMIDNSPGPTILRALNDSSGLLLRMIIQCKASQKFLMLLDVFVYIEQRHQTSSELMVLYGPKLFVNFTHTDL